MEGGGFGAEQPSCAADADRIAAAVASAAAELSGDLPLEATHATILAELERLLGAEVALLYDLQGVDGDDGIDDGGRALRLVADRGATDELAARLAAAPPTAPTLAALAAGAREVQRVDQGDAAAAELLDAREIFARPGTAVAGHRCALAAPLLGAGGLLGVVVVVVVVVVNWAIGEARAAPAEPPVALLRALSGVLAVALSAARERERRARERERTAREREDLRAARDALHDSEERLDRTLDDAPIGMALVGLDGRFLRVNRALCRIVGYDRDELLRLRFQQITHPDDLEADLAQAERLLRGEIHAYQLAKRYIRKGGAVIDVMLSGSIVRDGSGRPLHFVAQVEDVTEKMRVEEVLLTSERQFHGVFDHALDAILIVDDGGRLVDANPAACVMLRAPRQSLVGEEIFGLMAEPARVRAQWERFLRSGELQGETSLHLRDGRMVAVEASARAHFLPGRHVAILRDVSARRRAETALRMSEARFRLLADQINDIVFQLRVKPAYVCEYMSPSVQRITGYPPEAWYSNPEFGLSIVHPEDLPRYRRSLEDLQFNEPLRVVHKDGHTVWIENRVTVLRDEFGEPVAIAGVTLDITGRKHAAEEQERLVAQLADERRWLGSVIEESSVGIVLLEGPSGQRVTANRRMEELLGVRLAPDLGPAQYAERVRTPDGAAVDVDDVPGVRALEGEVTQGRELLLAGSDGPAVPVLASAGPIRDDQGRILGSAVMYEEITALKQLERVREEWTSLVAHDLRQPVTIILGYAAVIARRAEEPIRGWARHMVASARRLERMIRDLHEASRIDARQLGVERQPTDLPALVRAVVERLAQEADGCAITVAADGDIPPLDVDPGRIEQVLGNLLSNALRYGDPASEIRVAVAPRGPEVEVSVENRGPGIAEADLPRLFQRFQRGAALGAKRADSTGLGLYICRGIVEAHGGRIWAESTPGEATIFRFTLPGAAPAEAPEAPPRR